jgi:hypothetical protein
MEVNTWFSSQHGEVHASEVTIEIRCGVGSRTSGSLEKLDGRLSGHRACLFQKGYFDAFVTA